MGRPRLVRFLLLGGVAACLLVAFGLLPGFAFLSDLAQPPASILNDTRGTVLVAHCSATCPPAGGTSLAPGQELRAGPPGSAWVVRSPAGGELGCLTATSAGQRLTVSRATRCGR